MINKYYIYVKKRKVYVSKEVFQGYWQLTNHEKYMKRLDRKYRLTSFSSLDTEELNFRDSIPDKGVDIEKIIETKLRIEALYQALNSLNQEELDIIQRLYFDEQSLREVAKEKAVSPSSIMNWRNKILVKLKKLLEKTL